MLGHLRGFEDQRWIGGGVLRRVFLQAGEIARVRDDPGELLELVELAEGGLGLGFTGFGNGTHNIKFVCIVERTMPQIARGCNHDNIRKGITCRLRRSALGWNRRVSTAKNPSLDWPRRCR